MKKIFPLIIVFLLGCKTINPIHSDSRNEENLEVVFYPHKSSIESTSHGKISVIPKLEDDLFIILSEKESLVMIYPFYKSDPNNGNLIFRISTAKKDKNFYEGNLLNPRNGEKMGAVWITHKNKFVVKIELVKENYSLTFEFKCKKKDEHRSPVKYDYVLLLF